MTEKAMAAAESDSKGGDEHLVYAHDYFAGHPSHLFTLDLVTGKAVLIGRIEINVADITFMGSALYGIKYADDLRRSQLLNIDPVTAQGTVVGNLAYLISGLAGVGDTLYGIGGSQLIAIDPSTCDTELVGGWSEYYRVNGDIAVDDQGTAYVALLGGNGKCYLATLDLNTGALTILGDTGFPYLYGLDFWGDGLYGVTGNGELVRLNILSGAGTLIAPTQPKLYWGGMAVSRAATTSRAVAAPIQSRATVASQPPRTAPAVIAEAEPGSSPAVLEPSTAAEAEVVITPATAEPSGLPSSLPHAPQISLSLDGEDDFVSIPHHSTLDLANDFTIEVWGKFQKLIGVQRIFAKPSAYSLGLHNDQLRFTAYGHRDYDTSEAKLAVGTWYHLAVVFDSRNKAHFYVNGQLVQSLPGDSSVNVSSSGCEIGKDSSHGEHCYGQISELRIWNKARTPQEIQAAMSCRLQGKEPGLVGYWPLDEGSGDMAHDRGPNAHDGVLNGAAWVEASDLPQLAKPSVGDVEPSDKHPSSPLPPEETVTAKPIPAPPTGPQTLWQIGKPGKGDKFLRRSKWTKEYTYRVGSDPDPSQPRVPALITVPKGRKRQGGTEKLHLQFTLERDYAEGELVFYYDRLGIEEDTLLLDGNLLTKISGAGEGKLRQSQIPLGAASRGDHVLTITTSGGPGDGHFVDYFALRAVPKPA